MGGSFFCCCCSGHTLGQLVRFQGSTKAETPLGFLNHQWAVLFITKNGPTNQSTVVFNSHLFYLEKHMLLIRLTFPWQPCWVMKAPKKKHWNNVTTPLPPQREKVTSSTKVTNGQGLFQAGPLRSGEKHEGCEVNWHLFTAIEGSWLVVEPPSHLKKWDGQNWIISPG